jgi:hypothetical protein
MKSDYQLRHKTLGLLGTFWARQVSNDTKEKARNVTAIAGCADMMQRLDVACAFASSTPKTLIENVSFPFIDGDFAVVGTDFEAYNRSVITIDGQQQLVAFRDIDVPGDTANPEPRPHHLARLSQDFLSRLPDLTEFPLTSTWYLLPTPIGVTPILIASANPDIVLTAGVDFTAHDGYIAMRDNPGEVFGSGFVRVMLAYAELEPANSYPLTVERKRYGNKFIAEYFAKTQSLKAFRQAAAEYCGMLVLPADDFVLSASELPEGRMLYVLAIAGAVRVDYPHHRLMVGQAYAAGHVVSSIFDLRTAASHGAQFISEGMHEPLSISLDGCLPVKGLYFVPGVPIKFEYRDDVGVNSDNESWTHGWLYLNGEEGPVVTFWSQQREHEIQTGQYLSKEYNLDFYSETPDFPGVGVTSVDFGALLENFYGSKLGVFIYDELPASMQFRFEKFLAEHKPSGCVLLTAKIPATV